MPKYQYRRPYYPYVRGNQYQNPNAGISGAIDTGTKMGEMVAKAIAANKQNQIANQLAAQYGLYAPRAQWVGGTPPPAGVNTQGTSLADQGGVEGLKLRMAMQQQQQTRNAANIKTQLQQALIDQARGKAKSVWTGKTGTNPPAANAPAKTAAYKAGAYNYEDGTLNGQKTPDSMEYIQKDLDANAGKNAANSLLAAVPSMKVVNGKLTILPPTDANGKPLLDSNDKPIQSKYRINSDGSFSVMDAYGNPTTTIQQDDLKTTLARLNALKIRNGQTPLPNPYLQGTEKTSSFDPGTKENPYDLSGNNPNTTFRALPFNSYFKNPKTGNIELKQAPGQTPQNTVQQPNTPNVSTLPGVPPGPNLPGHIPLRPTASTDESGGDSALAQNNIVPPDQSNAPVQPNTPVPPNASDTGGTIARIDPNTFAPPTQQDRNQIADAVLPNRDVVPTVTDDDRDKLNRMIAGQNLIDQYAQT